MRTALATSAALLWATSGAAGDFFTLTGHGGPIMGIAVSETDQIATVSFDNAVGLWSDQTPVWFDGHEAAVNAVLFAPDGRVYSAGDDFTLRVWGADGSAQAVWTGHKGKVVSLALSPDGSTVASASWDGTIGLWPIDGRSPVFLTGHSGPVNDVAFTADGTGLYSASADGSIRLWDLSLNSERQRVIEHGFGVNEIELNENAGWLAYGAVDGGTRVLDLATGNTLADLTLERRPILSMALSQDGTTLAVGDGEGYIMVVDTPEWRIARDFRATERGPVWALAFSNDGTNIHAGGLDPRMYSWPIAAMGEADPMATGSPSFLQAADTMPNGERQFMRKCSICHTLTPGSARRAGPSLYDLFGRRAGTVEDYTYSDALDGSDIIWDEDTIDALFDIGPEHYIPGTKMPMQRITEAQDRADLVTYLRKETAPEESSQ
ncbi:c-type cytochrome [Marivita sp. XM-24bin2]|uniref:c-type cytochrome n=1 Tax=unclassified Marivita TaxID=2632480 RepID=UPI000D79004A|nr:c-type cytochrome [Marivita sp. XM-24bin2]MCR9111434.1 c-type cytochrome [Paracoccaceae bacterium]PWL34023.1 MAG: cytochrome C [Marivita sp. XM-24bin2]